MNSGNAAVKYDFLAVMLSLLFHAALLLAIYALWEPPMNVSPLYVEVDLAAQPADKPPTKIASPPTSETPAVDPTVPAQGRLLPRESRSAQPEPPGKLPAPAIAPDALAEPIPDHAGAASGGAIMPPRVREQPAARQGDGIAAGLKGSVLLTAEILTDGTVGRVLVAKSSGQARTDQAARAQVLRWRFEPARLPDGSPVKVQTAIWIRYE